MWLDHLKELKKQTGMSSKQIAELTNLPERTVTRIFSGDTDNPYVDTLRRIVAVLGGSLDDIFAEGQAVIGDHGLKALQDELEAVKAENVKLAAENAMLKDDVATLDAQLERQNLILAHKDEIIALHDYYNKRYNK